MSARHMSARRVRAADMTCDRPDSASKLRCPEQPEVHDFATLKSSFTHHEVYTAHEAEDIVPHRTSAGAGDHFTAMSTTMVVPTTTIFF